MRLFNSSLARFVLAVGAILGVNTHCLADTFISGFEGDMSSTYGVDWTIENAHGTTFVPDGATEGTQALSISTNQFWTNAIRLDTEDLIDDVRLSETFDVDVTVDGINTDWRQLFVIMQGLGTGWTQVEVDLDGGDGFEPFATTNVSLDLADPVGDGSVNFKAAAQQARDMWDADPNAGAWWQVWFIIQGADLDSSPLPLPNGTPIDTIVDNVRFTGGPDADFNDDGFVDGIDLGIWEGSYATDDGGDANGDGITAGDDFLAWQEQYNPPPPLGTVAAVPEPTSLMLASLLGGSFVWRRKRL